MAAAENIKVLLRVRPPTDAEQQGGVYRKAVTVTAATVSAATVTAAAVTAAAAAPTAAAAAAAADATQAAAAAAAARQTATRGGGGLRSVRISKAGASSTHA